MKKKLFAFFSVVLLIAICFAQPVFASKSNQSNYIFETKTINNTGNVAPYSQQQPGGGTGYMLLGVRKGHSIDHHVTLGSFALAFGSTERILTQVFGVGSSLWGWFVSGKEPTRYAKIWGKVETHSAYSATLKKKIYWYEDSKFRTKKTMTRENKHVSCSTYDPYCWQK